MLTPEWKKATRSNPSGNCVECKFEKSTKSAANGHCVEVSRNMLHDSLVFVRDSKQSGALDANRTVISFTQEMWVEVLSEVKEEGMNWPQNATGMYVLTDAEAGTSELYFTKDEWEAFLDGVTKGEFDLPEVKTAVSA